MKNNYFIILSLILVPSFLYGQWKKASVLEDGRIQVNKVEYPQKHFIRTPSRSQEIIRITGYPKIIPANPAFKNFRNVTLEDLNGDGVDEVISGIADKIYVFGKDSLLWSASISGLARFPAATGDIDQDGFSEIVLLTGYNQEPGKIYVFQHDGNMESGWPRDFDGRWLLSAPALADLNDDGYLEIIFGDRDETQGNIYVLNRDGTLFHTGWPVLMDNIAATTPSIGDVDADGNPEIVICSTREIFVFETNGRLAEGWPQVRSGTKYSFQSQILTDLDGDGTIEIVGAGHGDRPIFYVLDYLGQDFSGWPKDVPGNRWTFNSPTIIKESGTYTILNARPLANDIPADMLYSWSPDGVQQTGFPIIKVGGTEGIITVGDVNDDQQPDIIFPSNLLNPQGEGFIHAYPMTGGEELPGFPIVVPGFTYLNGATLGEINGNGRMDLVVLSYTENPGNTPDTAYIHAFELPTSYQKDEICWPTYKGNNTRDGLVTSGSVTSLQNVHLSISCEVYPNPTTDYLHIAFSDIPLNGKIKIKLQSANGDLIYSQNKTGRGQINTMDTSLLPCGVYFLSACISETCVVKKVMVSH